jgi:aromatic ring hydroxylase
MSNYKGKKMNETIREIIEEVAKSRYNQSFDEYAETVGKEDLGHDAAIINVTIKKIIERIRK